MPFPVTVKRLRKEKGLTQVELAAKVGVAQPMIAQYEKGLKIPKINTAVALAKALGTTCEELLTKENTS